MEITSAEFKRIKNKLFLFVYLSNGKTFSYIVKDKYKDRLFDLLVDISILDKYN